MNIPNQDRDNDQEKMNKEAIHEDNRKEMQKAHAHENNNPNLGKDHNPTHHGAGSK